MTPAIDVNDYLRALIRSDELDKCGFSANVGRKIWYCCRLEGHEGKHGMVKMSVHRFTDEGKKAGSASYESMHDQPRG